ncbi:MAG: LTA synthase family protein [Chitinophagales bacterium]
MKQWGRYYAGAVVTFLLAFIISRTAFYLSLSTASKSLPVWLLTQWHGFPLDLSALSYVMMPVFLLEFIRQLTGKASRWIFAWFQLQLLLISLLTVADVLLYQEWGIRTHLKAIRYLQHPEEVWFSAGLARISSGFLATGFLYLLFRWLFQKLSGKFPVFRFSSPLAVLLIVPCLAVLVLFARGGWQPIPLQESAVFFSQQEAENITAENTLWHAAASIATEWHWQDGNRYRVMDNQKSTAIVQEWLTPGCDSILPVVTAQRPNVVCIIFEGWNARLMSAISGDSQHIVTPNFDALTKEGLLFTRCYASGERSDQGVGALFTGFPALPTGAIVNYPEKMKRLPKWPRPFIADGYQSLFLFGGQLEYGNLKGLIYDCGFQKIIEEKDINPAFYRGNLGVHDEHTFSVFHQELGSLQEPFLAALFTQSTHSEYDIPRATVHLPWANQQNGYVNALIYADSCLGDFFRKAKQTPWYRNTIFLLIADHGHPDPWNNNFKTKEMHHIPCMLIGGALDSGWRGQKISEVVSQEDWPGTIMQMCGRDGRPFQWSQNALNPCRQSGAHWVFTEGFGFVQNDSSEWVYDWANHYTVHESGSAGVLSNQAKAWLQQVMEVFIQ